MTYPDYETYRELYGRYLKKGPEAFFAKFACEGKSVLDLCSGGGELTEYALRQGASDVTVVDLAHQMAKPNLDANWPNRIVRMTMSVEDYLNCALVSTKYKPKFDIAVCRQGVNYWFKNVLGGEIASVVKPGGWLVFNTFGNKPSETPTVREYYHEGIAYKELSYLIDGKIHHVQAATGIPPHFTVFDWIDRDDYISKLSPHFRMEEVIDGPSSMWYCQRK